MKSDIEKRLEYVRCQREILQRTEAELQKQLEAEKPEFDFKAKMPVGSVWLGLFKVDSHFGNKLHRKYNHEPLLSYVDLNYDVSSIYHAQQIVKAAQEWHNKNTIGCFDPLLEPLKESLKAAEQDGVLQNLE